jgi:DMSO/TMAO reductase YedYZ molybdopterin-dependent catalytic subunit
MKTIPILKILFILRAAFLATALFAAAVSVAARQSAPAQAVTGPSEFKIGGAVTTPLVVTAADMKQLPRKTIRVVNTHNNNKTEEYQGVPLALFLAKAGVPQGDQIRGPWMTAYVLVQATDGYRVIFSLGETDSSFLDSELLLADTLNGAPLAGDEGPYKLIAPRDKRPGRWVKMVQSITIVRAPNP